jgi:purine-nucleoside phosphorylase
VAVPSIGATSDEARGGDLDRRIAEATDAIVRRMAGEPSLREPRTVVVLGSGLGGVVDLLGEVPRVRIPYREIPNVPGASVEGHAGELVAGAVRGVPTIILSGRVHPYEGYTQRDVTLLLRAVLALGTETVVLTNAAGGLNPDYEPGDVMLVADHINMSGDNPLRGPNLDRFGLRFPALVDAYDPGLRASARESADRTGVALHDGVYVMLAGPSYETRSEVRMLRMLGGDAVGMSTVHEAIVARHAGRRVVAFSLITNKATEDMEAATHDEVIEMGRVGAARLVTLLGDLLPRIG